MKKYIYFLAPLLAVLGCKDNAGWSGMEFVKVQDSIHETLTYMSFPEEHWMRIRTNNTLERINREIKRRTKVVGTFPDGESALMLVCARLRHVAGTNWGTKRYLNMDHLTSMLLSEEESTAAG